MDTSSLQQINNRAGLSSVNTAPVNTAVPETESFWGKDGFTFSDVLDIFNPLHHLPIVSKYYREQAGDDACEGSRLIGGALFGGLLGGAAGIVSSIANSAVRNETHQDVSEHLLEIADESFDNLAEGFLYTPAEGSSYTTAEGSSDTIESEKNRQEVKSQSVLADKDMINPFFAQILDEYSNEQPYFLSRESITTQRSREWGKV